MLTGQVHLYDQDIKDISSTQGHPLGTKGVTDDGRSYRYAKAGAAALVAGNLQQASVPIANHLNVTVAVAAAIGATEITVTLGATAATSGQYDEGFIVVNDATGEGHTYKVKSHPAADSAATLVLQLVDPIEVALTTSSQVNLVANPYNGTIINPTTQTNVCVGVPNVAVTAAYYYWAQSRGVCSVLAGGTAVAAAGSQIMVGTTAGGFVLATAGFQVLGTTMEASVDTEFNSVFLGLDT